MVREYVVEQLGFTGQGVVGKIRKRVGDFFNKGEEILNVEVGKANQAITAQEEGTIKEFFVQEGEQVKSGDKLFTVDIAKETSRSEEKQMTAESTSESRELNTVNESEYSENQNIIDTEVAIIGGGPGGYVAAIRCTQNRLKTVLIEHDKLGGTCLNRGCIPTKALVSVTSFISNLKNADKFGISIPNWELSLEKIRNKKDEIVSSLVKGIEFLMKKHKIEVVKGKADIEKEGVLSVEGKDQKIRYKKLILATGSEVQKLPIPGADLPDILTSDELLELKDIPESLTIIGGGVIGMEFAFIYSALGCKVNVVEFLPQILSLVDTDAASAVKRSARQRGIQIFESSKAVSIESDSDGKKVVTIERKGNTESITTEKVAIAVGRRANINSVDIEKLGVELNERKKGIKVNQNMQTSNPSVYAIGDVTNQVMLAHAASRQGIIAADHIAGIENNEGIDPHLIPSAIFTYPEIGHIGYSVKEARKENRQVITGKFPLAANSKAVAMQEPDGFVKVVADKETREIIGATIVGAEATELLSLLTNLVTGKVKLDEAEKVIYAHPTVSEAISEAIMGASGKAIHFG